MASKFTEKLTELNKLLQQATTSKDPEAFAKLLHNDWLTVDAAGGVTEKNAEVEALAKEQVNVDYEITDLMVRNFGENIAIAVGTTKTNGTAMDLNVEGEFRFLQIWANPSAVGASGNDWLMLACINFLAQNFPSA